MRPLLCLLIFCSVAFAETVADRKVVLGLVDTCAQAPKVHEAEGFKADGTVRAIYYDALTWKGKPTRVFAWIGLPAKREGKVPGMVLVHGGGGTAFKEWVQKWNAQGFAAISIAVEGQTDVNENKVKGRSSWARHGFAGPARDGTFADTNANGVLDCCELAQSCCIGDIFQDGLVNGADLGTLLGAWGTPGPGDLNGDGIVNGADLGVMLGAWR